MASDNQQSVSMFFSLTGERVNPFGPSGASAAPPPASGTPARASYTSQSASPLMVSEPSTVPATPTQEYLSQYPEFYEKNTKPSIASAQESTRTYYNENGVSVRQAFAPSISPEVQSQSALYKEGSVNLLNDIQNLPFETYQQSFEISTAFGNIIDDELEISDFENDGIYLDFYNSWFDERIWKTVSNSWVLKKEEMMKTLEKNMKNLRPGWNNIATYFVNVAKPHLIAWKNEASEILTAEMISRCSCGQPTEKDWEEMRRIVNKRLEEILRGNIYDRLIPTYISKELQFIPGIIEITPTANQIEVEIDKTNERFGVKNWRFLQFCWVETFLLDKTGANVLDRNWNYVRADCSFRYLGELGDLKSSKSGSPNIGLDTRDAYTPFARVRKSGSSKDDDEEVCFEETHDKVKFRDRPHLCSGNFKDFNSAIKKQKKTYKNARGIEFIFHARTYIICDAGVVGYFEWEKKTRFFIPDRVSLFRPNITQGFQGANGLSNAEKGILKNKCEKRGWGHICLIEDGKDALDVDNELIKKLLK